MRLRGFWMALAIMIMVVSGSVSSQEDAIAPQVIDIFPLPGTEMAWQMPLTLTFNQPMQAESVMETLTFSPEISGGWRWLDERTLQFTPTDRWLPQTVYTLTVAPGAESRSGAVFHRYFSVEIVTTGELLVSDVIPAPEDEDVQVDSQIVVNFNRPIVPLTAVEEADTLPDPLIFEPAVTGSGEWITPSLYRFTPDDLLASGQTYTVQVSEVLVSVDGASFNEPFEWSFETRFPRWDDPSAG